VSVVRSGTDPILEASGLDAMRTPIDP
jgi:hypothetical protein